MFWFKVKWAAALLFWTAFATGGVTVGLKAGEPGRDAVEASAEAATGATDLPYGHPDFYPSPLRPIGFQGDGNGCYPGAHIPDQWSSGTVVKRPIPYPEEQMKKDAWRRTPNWDLADDKAVNVVWQTPLPGFTNSSPIVAGDRVFTVSDPDLIFCLDARTGAILWQAALHPYALALGPGAKADLCQELGAMLQVILARRKGGGYFRLPDMSEGFRAEWLRELQADRDLLTKAVAMAKGELGTSKTLADCDTLIAAVKGIPVGAPQRGGYEEIGRKYMFLLNPLLEELNVLLKQNPSMANGWYGSIGFSFATPVSDGEGVYVCFAQGQAARFDLDGKQRWATFIPADLRNESKKKGYFGHSYRASNCPSPLLVDGVFVVQSHNFVAGLDQKDGKLLWTDPSNNAGGYAAGTHKVLWLGDDGKSFPVVVTTSGHVIRPRDGKMLGDLPLDMGGEGGRGSITGRGRLMIADGRNGQDKAVYIWELAPQGADAVSFTVKAKTGRQYSTPRGPMCSDSWFWMGNRTNTAVWDLKTGAGLASAPPGAEISKWIENILVGNRLISSEALYCNAYGRDRSDRRIYLKSNIIDVSDPRKPRLLDTFGLLDGTTPPKRIEFTKHAPDLLDALGMPVTPPQFGYGAPTAQGYRLFIRGVAQLHCIGDPKEPWHTPTSAPAVARVNK